MRILMIYFYKINNKKWRKLVSHHSFTFYYLSLSRTRIKSIMINNLRIILKFAVFSDLLIFYASIINLSNTC